MKLQEMLGKCRQERRAILASNFYNLETLRGVLTAARRSGQPLILQLTESSIDYMGLGPAVALARASLKEFEVTGWIHLDHGGSFELARRCLDAGFDSVMIDGSELPFEANVELSARVVKLAAPYGANVEAELGYIAKLGQASKVEYTDPATAKAFVDATGVNALAVAIGTAHGFYKSTPKLDLDTLAKIRDVVPAALVLHGASGVPDDQLQESVRRGICKINLATELKNGFMEKLKQLMTSNSEIDLRKVFPPATEAVAKIAEEKMRVIAAASAKN